MKKFGLVVLGAHTTNHTRDEIEKFREKPILLIEPVPANVNAIKENLKDFTNVIIEPIAIANKAEKRNFYFVKSDSIAKLGKHWATGIGSFDKNHLLNHKSKRFKIEEVDIETIQIDCLTFEDILKKHKISEIEKMIIDIEGSEYEILKDIDLQKIKISNILFEFKHFDGVFQTGDKLKEIINKFEKNNYKTSKIDEENMLAVKK